MFDSRPGCDDVLRCFGSSVLRKTMYNSLFGSVLLYLYPLWQNLTRSRNLGVDQGSRARRPPFPTHDILRVHTATQEAFRSSTRLENSLSVSKCAVAFVQP